MMRRVRIRPGAKGDVSCQLIRQAISAEIDGEKPGIRARLTVSHLTHCQQCRQFQQLAPTLGGLVGVTRSRPVPGPLRAALLNEVRSSERSSSDRAVWSRRSVKAVTEQRWGRRIQWIGALTPAAFLLVVLPLGVLSSPREVPSHDSTPCTVDLPAPHGGLPR
jgi:hypothetical protein